MALGMVGDQWHFQGTRLAELERYCIYSKPHAHGQNFDSRFTNEGILDKGQKELGRPN